MRIHVRGSYSFRHFKPQTIYVGTILIILSSSFFITEHEKKLIFAQASKQNDSSVDFGSSQGMNDTISTGK